MLPRCYCDWTYNFCVSNTQQIRWLSPPYSPLSCLIAMCTKVQSCTWQQMGWGFWKPGTDPIFHFPLLCLSFPAWHIQVCNQKLLFNGNEKQEIWGQSFRGHFASLNWISLGKVPFFLTGEKSLKIHSCFYSPYSSLVCNTKCSTEMKQGLFYLPD